MKSIIKLGFAALIITSTLVSSCGKYEEGPKMSLASKKGRLANAWKFEAYYENGVDLTSQVAPFYTDFTAEFTKDGKYTMTWGSLTDTGTWEFINDKESVSTLSSVAGSTADTMNIIRLKGNELWVKDISGTNTYITHYATK